MLAPGTESSEQAGGDPGYFPDRNRSPRVIDFGLTHLDTRAFELAIARTYHAPEVRDGYRAQLDRI